MIRASTLLLLASAATVVTATYNTAYYSDATCETLSYFFNYPTYNCLSATIDGEATSGVQTCATSGTTVTITSPSYAGSSCSGNAQDDDPTDTLSTECTASGNLYTKSGCAAMGCPATNPSTAVVFSPKFGMCDGSNTLNIPNPEVAVMVSGQCLPSFEIQGPTLTGSYITATCGTDGTMTVSQFSESTCTTSAGDDVTLDTCYDGSSSDPVRQSYHFACGCTSDNVTPSSGGCFDASASVTLQDGSVVAIADVKVGDYVQAVAADGSLVFDKVFRIPHHDVTEQRDGVRITTSSGHQLEVTRNHFIHSGACCSLPDMVEAGTVAVGDVVFVAAGTEGAVQASTVVRVESMTLQGAVNVHTLNAQVVVSGVAASHFTTATRWSPEWRAWAPVWYSAVDLLPGAAEDASA